MLCWLTVSKAYGLTIFFLLLGFTLFELSKPKNKLSFFLSGFFLGMATGCRLIVVALAPVYLFLIFFKYKKGNFSFVASWFFLGLLVSLMPLIGIYLYSYEQVWFNLLGYHVLKSDASFLEDAVQRLDVLKSLLRLDTSGRYYGPQFAVLTLLSASYLFKFPWKNKTGLSAAIIALALGAIHFYPSPTYIQYFFFTGSIFNYWRNLAF